MLETLPKHILFEEEQEAKTYNTNYETNVQKESQKPDDPDVRRDVDYDSFDTFLFYSIHVIKKWLLVGLPFSLLSDTFAGKNFNSQEMKKTFQDGKEFIWPKNGSPFKKVVTIILSIPVVLIATIYAILIALIVLFIALICLIVFVLFVDLPFFIVLAIQLTLLFLLIFYTTLPSCETLASQFLESGVWYTQLIWMVLFAGLMIKEYDDMGKSLIYISSYYRNKKIPSAALSWFYIIFSSLPQFVQFLVTSTCAWFSVQLIFKCSSYLSPFSHFSGLFVILQVDSFIMSFIKFTGLYVPPGLVFNSYEENEAKKREAEKERKRIEDENREKKNLPKIEEEKKVEVYTWDRIHFSTKFIWDFFKIKSGSGPSIKFDPRFDDDEEGMIAKTRLTYLSHAIKILGMGFIVYNFIAYVVDVTCCC